MLRPTLIVGLGTSGLRIVSEIQKLMYETFGVNRLPIFRFLYIETDTGKSHEQTPAGSDIIPLTITVQSLQQAYRVLANNPDLNMDWIAKDLPNQLSYNAQGAGGVRPAGRLLLWGDGNFQKVYDAIADAYREIANAASLAALDPDIKQKAGGVDTRKPVMYVVGTLVGGTCSGSFIDVGYILRHIAGLAEDAYLHGIFVVPGTGLPLSAGYGNAYGALKELEFFRQPENFYEEVWPNGVRLAPQNLPPYSIVYLISSEYGRAGYSSMGLDGCLRVTALRLFCDLVGLSSSRGAVLADGMNEGFGFYATFGISAILYPKYTLMEALGCDQGQSLCDRWLMALQYRTTTGETVGISQKDVLDEADRFLADQLQRLFGSLNAKGAAASGLEGDIDEDIERILRAQEDQPPQFMIGRFAAGKVANYYGAVSDNVSAAQDQLIRAIRDFVYQKIKETENVDYIEGLLEQLGVSMQNVLEYWARCGIPSSASEWNDRLTRVVNTKMFKNQYSWLGQRRSIFRDHVHALLRDLKMFCLGTRVLPTIRGSLVKGSLTTSDQLVALPTLEQLKRARKNLQDARDDLRRRAAALADEVMDASVPIHRVWHSGTFEADKKNLSQAYSARYGVPSLSDVSLEAAWDLLTTRSSRELFAVMKVGYEARFREFLPSVNVTEEAVQRLDLTREYAERALAGLLRLTLDPHRNSPGVPRFVLGADAASLTNLVVRLREKGFHDFNPGESGGGHVRPLALLDHAVIFYEEQSRINPLTMLTIGPTLEQHFLKPGRDSSGVQISDETVWKQQRLAYNVGQRAITSRCFALVQFVLDFAIVWERSPSDSWNATAVRWTQIPVQLGQRLRFSYSDQANVGRDFALDPDPRYIREVANGDGHIRALTKAVTEAVRDQGEAKLGLLFEQEVKPYLARRYGPERAKDKTEFYFGSSSERNGLIQSLL